MLCRAPGIDPAEVVRKGSNDRHMDTDKLRLCGLIAWMEKPQYLGSSGYIRLNREE